MEKLITRTLSVLFFVASSFGAIKANAQNVTVVGNRNSLAQKDSVATPAGIAFVDTVQEKQTSNIFISRDTFSNFGLIFEHSFNIGGHEFTCNLTHERWPEHGEIEMGANIVNFEVGKGTLIKLQPSVLTQKNRGENITWNGNLGFGLEQDLSSLGYIRAQINFRTVESEVDIAGFNIFTRKYFKDGYYIIVPSYSIQISKNLIICPGFIIDPTSKGLFFGVYIPINSK